MNALSRTSDSILNVFSVIVFLKKAKNPVEINFVRVWQRAKELLKITDINV